MDSDGNRLSFVFGEEIPEATIGEHGYIALCPVGDGACLSVDYIPKVASEYEFATVYNYGWSTGGFTITGHERTWHLAGQPGTWIDRLVVKYWFYEKNRC